MPLVADRETREEVTRRPTGAYGLTPPRHRAAPGARVRQVRLPLGGIKFARGLSLSPPGNLSVESFRLNSRAAYRRAGDARARFLTATRRRDASLVASRVNRGPRWARTTRRVVNYRGSVFNSRRRNLCPNENVEFPISPGSQACARSNRRRKIFALLSRYTPYRSGEIASICI